MYSHLYRLGALSTPGADLAGPPIPLQPARTAQLCPKGKKGPGLLWDQNPAHVERAAPSHGFWRASSAKLETFVFRIRG